MLVWMQAISLLRKLYSLSISHKLEVTIIHYSLPVRERPARVDSNIKAVSLSKAAGVPS